MVEPLNNVVEIDKRAARLVSREEHDRAVRESDAAYALMNLGDLLRLSYENGGFEGLNDNHMVSIGIAIQQLGESLYRGSIAKTLEQIELAPEL